MCAESTHPAGIAEPQVRTHTPDSQADSAGGALHRSIAGLEPANLKQDFQLKVGQSIIHPDA